MKVILLICMCISLEAMESAINDFVTITFNRGSGEQEDMALRALGYVLENASATFTKDLTLCLRKKIKESAVLDDALWDTVRRIDTHESLSHSDEERHLKKLKKLITASIEESFKDRQEQTTDAVLQLQMKDKDLKEERYKLYGALIGLVGVALTSVVTIVTVIVSQDCTT